MIALGFVIGCLIGYAVFGHYTDKVMTCVVLDLIAVASVVLYDICKERRK